MKQLSGTSLVKYEHITKQEFANFRSEILSALIIYKFLFIQKLLYEDKKDKKEKLCRKIIPLTGYFYCFHVLIIMKIKICTFRQNKRCDLEN